MLHVVRSGSFFLSGRGLFLGSGGLFGGFRRFRCRLGSGGIGGGLRLGCAGSQTEHHDRCKQQCDDLFHVCSSIMFNLYDCGDKIPMIIVQD